LDLLFLAVQAEGILPEIPSLEYLGALTVAMFFAYMFITGKIISRKESDERVEEWKQLAVEAAKENNSSTQDLVARAREYNESMKVLVLEVKALNDLVRENNYQIRSVKDNLPPR
jgi:uncharacterized iron-regulated membrane protein